MTSLKTQKMSNLSKNICQFEQAYISNLNKCILNIVQIGKYWRQAQWKWWAWWDCQVTSLKTLGSEKPPAVRAPQIMMENFLVGNKTSSDEMSDSSISKISPQKISSESIWHKLDFALQSAPAIGLRMMRKLKNWLIHGPNKWRGLNIHWKSTSFAKLPWLNS